MSGFKMTPIDQIELMNLNLLLVFPLGHLNLLRDPNPSQIFYLLLRVKMLLEIKQYHLYMLTKMEILE